MISLDFGTFKNCLRMWEIWAKYFLPKALKSCTKFKKSLNLVTLPTTLTLQRKVRIKHSDFLPKI